MKRIWRSFNFNIGRILAYIVVGLIIALFSSFLNLANVSADFSENWYENIKYQTGYFNSFELANGSYNSMDVWTDCGAFDGDVCVRNAYHGTVSNTGTSVALVPLLNEVLEEGYLYNVTYYVCTRNNPDYSDFGDVSSYSVLGGASLLNNSLTAGTTYSRVWTVNLSSNYYDGSHSGSTDCVAITMLVVPNQLTRYLAVSLNDININTGWFGYLFLGYDYEAVGLYTDTLADVINGVVEDSGLASAESVEQVQEAVDEVKQEVSDLNDNITSTDTSGSEEVAGGFFDDFDNEDYGLSDIITMPLQVINNITSATCSPLELPLPFVDTDVTLPCMYDIYDDYFGGFLTIYQTITFGIVAYWVCINIFRMVKNFKNPDNDEVEVLDL